MVIKNSVTSPHDREHHEQAYYDHDILAALARGDSHNCDQARDDEKFKPLHQKKSNRIL